MSEIQKTLIPGRILGFQVGYSRTAVLAETPSGLSCGLAATLSNPEFEYRCHPSVKNAGHLLEMNIAELTRLVDSGSFTEVAIGLATINALLPMDPGKWVNLKAENYLLQYAADKNIAMVGHFPFIDKLKPAVRNLWVLELDPREGDLPASMAPEILPRADIVAITATTLINHTFEGLLKLCQPHSKVMLLGPSTPLSPVFFDFGVDLLCGTIVTDPKAVMLGLSQGSSSHQLHHAGATKMVTLEKGR
ncbi:MAG: DUF364 domain-containing protein [Chloroflexi bacterium]|nr:DUF364 domain-containing protein [Chloroflexota bacterium]